VHKFNFLRGKKSTRMVKDYEKKKRNLKYNLM